MRITQPHRRVAGKVHGFLPAVRMNPPATIETYADATRFGQTGCLIGSERRRNLRIPLHWALYLACNNAGPPLRTITRDINKDGFYCLLDQPLSPGEQIECDIVVPAHRSQDPGDVAYLRCRARVARVETIRGTTEFGLACRIHDYSLITVGSVETRSRAVFDRR